MTPGDLAGEHLLCEPVLMADVGGSGFRPDLEGHLRQIAAEGGSVEDVAAYFPGGEGRADGNAVLLLGVDRAEVVPASGFGREPGGRSLDHFILAERSRDRPIVGEQAGLARRQGDGGVGTADRVAVHDGGLPTPNEKASLDTAVRIVAEVVFDAVFVNGVFEREGGRRAVPTLDPERDVVGVPESENGIAV